MLFLLAFVWGACKSEKASNASIEQEQGTGVSTTSSCSGPNPDYEAELRLKRLEGHFRILSNGFPVEELPFMGTATDQSVTADLNTALVREGNELTVEVMPFLTRSDKRLDIGGVEMRGWVCCNDTTLSNVEIAEAQVDRAYKAWSERARAQWQEYLEWEQQWLEKNSDSSSLVTARDGGALDSMRQWTARNRLSVSTTFDNESGPDFSKIFEEAPVITDTSRLKDYAVRLRNLLRSGNAEALYREIRPSISEETGWFNVTREGTREAALTEIREEWAAHYRTDFPRSKIRLRRWSGGRVWELYVIGPTGERRSFFSKGPSAAHLEVYVGEIDGKLRVVRLT